MKISVIIPHFQNYSTIGRALESIIRQTIPVHEIIIVDDCSSNPKKLEEVLSAYYHRHPNIKLLRNQENKNGAFSRNRGIEEAKGEIIAFLDADDLWEPIKSKRVLESVQEFGLNNIFFSKAKIQKKGVIVESRPSYFNSNTHLSEYLFLEGGFIQTSAIFCGIETAKQIKFQEQFKRHQDYDFVLRAYNKGIEFIFLNEDLITYTEAEKISRHKGEAYAFSLNWLNKMKKYFSREGYLGFVMFNLTARLISEKKYGHAFINFTKALLLLKPTQWRRTYPKFKRSIFKLNITLQQDK